MMARWPALSFFFSSLFSYSSHLFLTSLTDTTCNHIPHAYYSHSKHNLIHTSPPSFITLGCNVSSCSLVRGDPAPLLYHNTPDSSACPSHSLISHRQENLPANRTSNNKNHSSYAYSINSHRTRLYSRNSHTFDCSCCSCTTVGFCKDQESSRWFLSSQVHDRNRGCCCCRGRGRHIDYVATKHREIGGQE